MIGERIKEARIKRFRGTVNQKEMAEILRKPNRTYENWELGVCSPKHNDIINLANLLKVDPGWLEFGPKPLVEHRGD